MIQHRPNLTKRMLKRAARARREHGIALLFTLCILSMALITAMIFSSNASTGRKVATAYVDTSAARILADGVVNRAILALMNSDNASYVCSNYNTNPPNGNASDYAVDWIWKLEKNGTFSFNDGPLRFNKTTYYDRNDSRCPSWEYVYNKNAYGDSNNSTERIYGRFAYVAIGQNDQLNPNAIGRRNYDGFDNTIFQKRLGRWTCEPQFIFKSARNNWDYSRIITPDTIRGKYSGPEGWTDIELFVDDMAGTGSSPAGGSSADKQLKMMADQYFDVAGEDEYNKFRADGQAIGDLTKHDLASGESFRFPLIRNDWDNISLGTVKGAIPWFANATSAANVNQTVANLINYNASINRAPVTDNDNWLTGEPTYTGNKRTPYINEAHADVAVAGSLGIRVPRREVEGDPPVVRWYVKYTDCTYSHQITINVETVNMYPTTGGSDGALAVRNPILIGEISYDYQVNATSGAWATQSIRFDAGTQWTEIAQSGSDAGYKVYTFMLDNGAVGSVTTPERGPYDRPMGHDADFYEYIRVKNVRLSLDRIVLQDNSGRNADLSLMPTQLQTGRAFMTAGNGEQVAGSGDFSRHFYFDTQANDPRLNLGRNDWSTPLFSEKENEVGATVGATNSTINRGSYYDNEKRTDPVYAGNDSISTAYIRHGQMLSLWELGAIHRGAPWQTINLKCASKNGTKMEAYQTGDGHLLDQVALATSTDRANDAVPGLINLNSVASFGGSSAPFAFKALFTNFPVYKTFAAMNSGSADGGTIVGDAVDSDKNGDLDADAYAKDLSEAVTYAISQGNLPRRTAVFPTSYGTGGQLDKIVKRNVPDAEAEEIFCRVVNLLKWNKQPLKRATVLVLAQTIKDIGGASLERVISDKDIDVLRDSGIQAYSNDAYNKVRNLDTSMKAATIRSNYGTRTVALKTYDNFYDQITGEAKVIVRLEWDESAHDNKGAWKITRKEYAE